MSLLAVFGTAQVRLTVSATRQPDELTEASAFARADALLAALGKRPLREGGARWSLQRHFPDLPERVYDINRGDDWLDIDSRTGLLLFYVDRGIRPASSVQARAYAMRTPPSSLQTQSIASSMARAVGLPPNARLTHFAVRDRNPHGDADMRGYFAATYVGSDRSELHLVFDRRTGRLENLIRSVPHARGATPRRPAGARGGVTIPLPVGAGRRPLRP